MDFKLSEIAQLADSWRQDATCSKSALVVFTRQLATLTHSGLPILPSLEALSEQEDTRFGLVVQDLQEQISSGKYISQALACFPGIFFRSYVAMVKVAESTGALAPALSLIGDWLEHENRVYQKVKSSLTYPALVLTCAAFMTIYLFCKVMPGFVTIFEEIGAELPLLTVILMKMTAAATSPWSWIIVASLVLFLVTERRRVFGQAKTQLAIFRFLTHLPLLSGCLQVMTMSKFCRALSAMLRSGLHLHAAVKLACDSSGNPLLVEASQQLIDDISSGESLSQSMASRPDIFPSMTCQIFAVGEETGRLERLSLRLAEMYQEDLENRLEQLTALFEPVLLLAASLAVGTILLGIFMPLYGYLGKLGG